MPRFSRAFAPLAAAFAAALVACSAGTEGDEDDAASALQDDAPTLDVTAFVRGLAASPTAPERKASGDALKRVMDVVAGQIARASEPEQADDQEFTKRLVGYSAEYLRSGEACDARDKIRLFRGIGSGSQPVLRASAGERKAGVHVAKPMMDAFRRLGLPAPGREAPGMEALNGVALYKALVVDQKPLTMRIDSDPVASQALSDRIARVSAETNTFSAHTDESLAADVRARAKQALDELKDFVAKTDFGFSYQFGLKRDFMDFDTSERRKVDLEWTAIALDHTQGAPWGTGAGSPFSPLISTSVNAIEKWGPFFIVADVCPERAVPSIAYVDAAEQEVYLPLFVLPEEIVAITTNPSELAQHGAPNAQERPLDAAYRACFSQESASVFDAMAAYRAAMKKGLPLSAFRAELRKGITTACNKPVACPAGCVASSYCKDNVARDPIKSATARYVNGAPCVVTGAPGCKLDGCN